jgi:hypothetical protein
MFRGPRGNPDATRYFEELAAEKEMTGAPQGLRFQRLGFGPASVRGKYSECGNENRRALDPGLPGDDCEFLLAFPDGEFSEDSTFKTFPRLRFRGTRFGL